MTISIPDVSNTESLQLPSFDDLPLSIELRKALDELGYTHPTPVQRAVYDPAVRGLDLVVQARTGTGKTASFGMPLLDSIVRKNQSTTQSLILCPTRELALQVQRELDRLAKYRGISVVAIYGGAPMSRQFEQLKAGAQIVVGTPGRVLDHLQRETLNPSNIRVCILDESDEMLSMGFLPQITEIFGYLPSPHQTLLFSATLPVDIQRMAETRLNDPLFLTLSGDQIGALDIQHLTYFSMRDKLDDLLRVIEVEDPESAIIFCNTKDETKRVAAALDRRGYDTEWLNADLAQADREKVMESTRKSTLRFLVCTDVAARGIDISHLTHVMNFDFPESPEAYVHRTGRTGRAGRTGTAISLITPADIGKLYILRLTYKIVPIQRQLPTRAEIRTREELDLVEMFVEAFASREHLEDDVMLARRLLSHESAEFVVAGLLRDHLGSRPEAICNAADARRSRLPNRGNDGAAKTVDGDRTGGTSIRPALVTSSATSSPGLGAKATESSLTVSKRRQRQDIPTTELGPGPVSTELEEDFDFRYTVGDLKQDGGYPSQATESAAAQLPTDPTLPNQNPQREKRAVSGLDDGPEIFVNIGRRDGVSSQDVLALLAQCAVPRSDILHVNVRHHHTFVRVRRPSFQTVLGTLDGAKIAGRVARAEQARGARE